MLQDLFDCMTGCVSFCVDGFGYGSFVRVVVNGADCGSGNGSQYQLWLW